VTFETHVPGADELTVQAMESWFEETEINRHWLLFFSLFVMSFLSLQGSLMSKKKHLHFSLSP